MKWYNDTFGEKKITPNQNDIKIKYVYVSVEKTKKKKM